MPDALPDPHEREVLRRLADGRLPTDGCLGVDDFVGRSLALARLRSSGLVDADRRLTARGLDLAYIIPGPPTGGRGCSCLT